MNAEEYIKYLDNELLPDQRIKFESTLRENKVYQKELAAIKGMKSFAKDKANKEKALKASKDIYTDFKNKVVSDSNKSTTEIKENTNSKTRLLKYLIPIAIAAMFIICFFATDWSSSKLKGNDQIYAKYFNPVELSLVVRSEGEQNLEKEAEISFNKKDYQAASDQLSKLLVNKPNDKKLLLYKAISEIAIGEQNSARSILSILSEDELYKSESNYFIGLSHLQSNNSAEALQNLKNIEADSYRFAEAQQIINILSEK